MSVSSVAWGLPSAIGCGPAKQERI